MMSRGPVMMMMMVMVMVMGEAAQASLPVSADSIPPSCILTNTPTCNGYLTNGVCKGLNWTASVIFRDSHSGMSDVLMDPPALELDVTGLISGTTDEVLADAVQTCCYSQASIKGVDVEGNVGQCNVDMGTIGGVISNFLVTREGDVWVELSWNITPSDLTIHHYHITINSVTTQQSFCTEWTCSETVLNLEPCTHHQFVLTPVFTGLNGEELTGVSETTEGATLEGGDPQMVTNGDEVEATETTITVTWDPPNLICPYTYQVCHYEVNTDPGLALCSTTSSTSYTIESLEECKAYYIDVVTLSNGLTSSPFNLYSVTLCS
ncbi:hypothetical protein Pmani_020477 [Petrolisthes manimaculis]|uniref:Fibronectin type-III domain-containing protein n=1 Tax=Petrolisthes manimaculis TaxID=1843537 RepID=A0AAE1PG67_9EUCA|nr:hypothetical protein Pmani_020477 [Petrolisthes manimaculis]